MPESKQKQRFWRLITVCIFLWMGSVQAAADFPYGSAESLGDHLFEDASLSEPAGQSCASCHDAKAGFSDPVHRRPVSPGVRSGAAGNRNAPSIAYAAFIPPRHIEASSGLYIGGLFWDGRAATLEEQAAGPLLNMQEMANPDKASVIAKVRRSAYAAEFEFAYGSQIWGNVNLAFTRVTEAIAAYERTPEFAPFSSKYDAWLAGKVRLTPSERRGLDLYEGQAMCSACHPNRPDALNPHPLFTDHSYDNIGVPVNPANPFYQQPVSVNPKGRKFVDYGLGADLKDGMQAGKFKVPSLRNIAITAPYMHNGYFTTLEGAIAFYNNRDRRPRCRTDRLSAADAIRLACWPAPETDVNVNASELGGLGLTHRDIADLAAFLRTLTDGYTR